MIFYVALTSRSLFTNNVLLDKTIQICADTLYKYDSIVLPTLPKQNFVQLMTAATSSVEFSYNNVMFRQIEVTMKLVTIALQCTITWVLL